MAEGNRLNIITWGTVFDFPVGMFVEVEGAVVGLERPFDEALSDYRDYFDVTIVPDVKPQDFVIGLPHHRPYEELPLGRIRVEDVTFDGSRRKFITSPVLVVLVRDAQDKR